MNESNSLEDLASTLQILSFLILTNDFNNTDLMKYLIHQDELLNKIINQNKDIINLLKSEEIEPTNNSESIVENLKKYIENLIVSIEENYEKYGEPIMLKCDNELATKLRAFINSYNIQHNTIKKLQKAFYTEKSKMLRDIHKLSEANTRALDYLNQLVDFDKDKVKLALEFEEETYYDELDTKIFLENLKKLLKGE